LEQESISYKKWDKAIPPKRILVIRLQSIGDVAITIPACNSLRKLFPGSRIDYLTGELSHPMLSAFELFDNVYAFKDYSLINRPENSFRTRLDKMKEIKKWGLRLKENSYDIIIDLQRNRASRLLRFFSGCDYFSEFDRFSNNPAALRTLKTFHIAGFENVTSDCKLSIKKDLLEKTKLLLVNNSWDGKSRLVVLNPAGLWQTRNWPLENYIDLARLMLKDEDFYFLLIGDDRVTNKAAYIEEKLGRNVINLTGKTSLDEVFALFQFVYASVSEDSALVHFSWASGVPTLALLGSTRSDWTSPMPPHGASLNSTDLPCGDCMQPTCRFGDVHCLTRFTPEIVYEKLKELTSAIVRA
jgi:heptosyltransferase-2